MATLSSTQLSRDFTFKFPFFLTESGNLKVKLLQYNMDILLERKCVREDASAGGSVIKPMSPTIFKVTAYASVLSDTFSLLEDI